MSTPLQLSPLPSSSQERPDADRTTGASSGEAWMREMERAQLSNWFTPSTPASHEVWASRQAAHAATPPTQTRSPSPVALEWTSYARTPAFTAEASTASGATFAPASPRPAAHHKQLTPASIEHAAPLEQTRARTVRLLQAQLAPAQSPLTTPLSAQPDQPSLRLHLEPGADGGVAAWIGTELDETTLRQHLPLLLDTLRRSLHSQGLRLNLLTLNGRAVWPPSASEPAPHTSKEIPWPSTQ